MRILAVDPGEKRIGIALSDPTGTIATPLAILKHKSRQIDVKTIIQLTKENNAQKILIGQALNDDGSPTAQSKRAEHLAGMIEDSTNVPVILWDESGSTQAVRSAQIAMGVPRQKRRRPIDDLAAAYILQTYLDYHSRVVEDDLNEDQ